MYPSTHRYIPSYTPKLRTTLRHPSTLSLHLLLHIFSLNHDHAIIKQASFTHNSLTAPVGVGALGGNTPNISAVYAVTPQRNGTNFTSQYVFTYLPICYPLTV